MKNRPHTLAFVVVALAGHAIAQPAAAEDYDRVLRLDHYVGVRSTVPAIAGQKTPIYVREVVRASTALRDRGIANRVVLFIHGAGTPSEVAFDVPYQDFSWMEYLAQAGFDTFAMDTTGYGRSTRPAAMNDPCNLSAAQQLALAPDGRVEACSPSYGQQLTTIASDWNDIAAVVDYLRALRGAPAGRHGVVVARRPALRRLCGAKSRQGGQARSAGAGLQPRHLAKSPDAVAGGRRRDEHAVARRADGAVEPPGRVPGPVRAGRFQAVWQAMLDSDPVGATWGTGVRRAPNVTSWGWTTAVVAATKTPTLMVTGAHDKQVLPTRVHDLHADLGAKSKVLVDLACSSHNAMWEKNHLLLFQSSLEWLTKGTVNGVDQGVVRLGY